MKGKSQVTSPDDRTKPPAINAALAASAISPSGLPALDSAFAVNKRPDIQELTTVRKKKKKKKKKKCASPHFATPRNAANGGVSQRKTCNAALKSD
jgi:hypothetical protein